MTLVGDTCTRSLIQISPAPDAKPPAIVQAKVLHGQIEKELLPDPFQDIHLLVRTLVDFKILFLELPFRRWILFSREREERLEFRINLLRKLSETSIAAEQNTPSQPTAQIESVSSTPDLHVYLERFIQGKNSVFRFHRLPILDPDSKVVGLAGLRYTPEVYAQMKSQRIQTVPCEK